MIIHVRGQALGAYRRAIDPSCPDDEAAIEAIEEAFRTARPVGERRPDGAQRYRAARVSGAPWSRCYLVITGRGDVIDVQPESPHGSARTRPGRSERELARSDKDPPRGPARPAEGGHTRVGRQSLNEAAPARGRKPSARGEEKPTRGAGRPPEGPRGEARTEAILVRLSPTEREEIEGLATAEGRSIADVMRSAALVLAERRKLEG